MAPRGPAAYLSGILLVLGSLGLGPSAVARGDGAPICGTGRWVERWANEPVLPFLDELNDVNQVLLGRPLSLTRHALQQNGALHVRIDDVVIEGPEGHYSDGELGPSATWLWASQTPNLIEVFRVRDDRLEPIGELEASFAPGVRVQWASNTVLHYVDGSGDWAAVDVRKLRPRRPPASAPDEPALSVSESEGRFIVLNADGLAIASAPSTTADGPLVDPRLTRSGDGLCAHQLPASSSPVAIRCAPTEQHLAERALIIE